MSKGHTTLQLLTENHYNICIWMRFHDVCRIRRSLFGTFQFSTSGFAGAWTIPSSTVCRPKYCGIVPKFLAAVVAKGSFLRLLLWWAGHQAFNRSVPELVAEKVGYCSYWAGVFHSLIWLLYPWSQNRETWLAEPHWYQIGWPSRAAEPLGPHPSHYVCCR